MAYDYCFLRNGPSEPCVPALVMKDKRTKMLTCHVVRGKGADQDWVVSQALRDLERLGHHGDLTLRSDGEPAIVDLLKEIAKGRGNRRTILEQSPMGDSSGNGFIERGVQSVEEMTRVLKLDLERRIGQRIEVTHCVFAWLVEHAVDLLNKFHVAADGKTAFERLKGKKHRGEVLPFCAPVMLRVSGRVQGGVMAERWFEGIWLGKRFHTEEHLVARAVDGVVVRTRSVQQMPSVVTMELLNQVVGLPWTPAGVMKAAKDVSPPRLGPEEAVEVHEPFMPRSMRITRAMIEKFGISEHCQRCRLLAQGDTMTTVGHSRERQERIGHMIREDPALKAPLEQAEARQTRYVAAESERVMRV